MRSPCEAVLRRQVRSQAGARERAEYRFQYWRCMALHRLGHQLDRELLAVLGRAHPSWATLTADAWRDMVVEEFVTAKDLFLALENRSREEERMMDALEAFYIAAMEGRGFVEAGPRAAAPVSSGR